MKVPLECPQAEYRQGMQIWCRKLGNLCAHVYFKRCKGWWVLSDQAARCPVRKDDYHGDH